MEDGLLQPAVRGRPENDGNGELFPLATFQERGERDRLVGGVAGFQTGMQVELELVFLDDVLELSASSSPIPPDVPSERKKPRRWRSESWERPTPAISSNPRSRRYGGRGQGLDQGRRLRGGSWRRNELSGRLQRDSSRRRRDHGGSSGAAISCAGGQSFAGCCGAWGGASRSRPQAKDDPNSRRDSSETALPPSFGPCPKSREARGRRNRRDFPNPPGPAPGYVPRDRREEEATRLRWPRPRRDPRWRPPRPPPTPGAEGVPA